MSVPLLFSVFSVFQFPFSMQNSEAVIHNLLQQDIVSVNLVIPGADTLLVIETGGPIHPDEIRSLSFPWGFVSKVVLLSEDRTVYHVTPFHASSHPDTLIITPSSKEYGGILDRVYGVHPIVLGNTTGVQITSIHLNGDSDLTVDGNLLGDNPLMPMEYVRLWMERPDPVNLILISESGHSTGEILIAPGRDTVYSISNGMFFENGVERVSSQAGAGYSFSVANCITGNDIYTIESFDEMGYSVTFDDLSDDPLKLWDRITVESYYPPAFVICTDSLDRIYSLEEPDSILGMYVFDQLSLDFDFSFPERQ